MAKITIKDLSDSTELDRAAMQAIVGGARNGGRPWQPEPAPSGPVRIIDYPPGLAKARAAAKAPKRNTRA
ncbi:hypothetical protein ABC383_26735 [Noviherbaspirillum sp. 1P10PC]|uniref:hypothetical protein n=1 Tax=Noviherbaspirillum sp. 1P10PC TaxID=3132292 RepID=UPI0039A326DD